MAKTVHGMTETRLYRIWSAMKQRCENPNTINYKYYGAKGVCVCEEWRRDFRAFYLWAISNGYTNDLTLDRIDANKNYEPSNCRWVTRKEQQNNTSYTRLYTYNGETRSIMQWAEKTGMSPPVLYYRIRSGWSIEKALNTKQRKWSKK